MDGTSSAGAGYGTKVPSNTVAGYRDCLEQVTGVRKACSLRRKPVGHRKFYSTYDYIVPNAIKNHYGNGVSCGRP
jgi:hypothetical protein